jgi:hypothetical protein
VYFFTFFSKKCGFRRFLSKTTGRSNNNSGLQMSTSGCQVHQREQPFAIICEQSGNRKSGNRFRDTVHLDVGDYRNVHLFFVTVLHDGLLKPRGLLPHVIFFQSVIYPSQRSHPSCCHRGVKLYESPLLEATVRISGVVKYAVAYL